MNEKDESLVIPRELSIEAVRAAASLHRTLERAVEAKIRGNLDDASDKELSMIATDLSASADTLNDALDAIDDHIKERA